MAGQFGTYDRWENAQVRNAEGKMWMQKVESCRIMQKSAVYRRYYVQGGTVYLYERVCCTSAVRPNCPVFWVGQVSVSLVIHGLWWTVDCANLHQWGLTQSSSCDYGQRQTMNHTVDTCPLTKFQGGLNLLHEADDDAVIWLESILQRLQHRWTTTTTTTTV